MAPQIKLKSVVPVIAIDEYGRVVARFPSQTAAAAKMNTSQGGISEASRGLREKAGGYFWRIA